MTAKRQVCTPEQHWFVWVGSEMGITPPQGHPCKCGAARWGEVGEAKEVKVNGKR